MTESLLDFMGNDNAWKEFYQWKLQDGHSGRKQLKELEDFIRSRAYIVLAETMQEGHCCFGLPRISRINKGQTGRKRTIYQYAQEETWMLKHLAYRMHKYDAHFSNGCYSFRRDRNARHAVADVLRLSSLDQLYLIKADVHNYFNSIPVEPMCQMLVSLLGEDERLLGFLQELLRQNRAIDSATGAYVEGARGVMAGTPLSPFFANLYLTDMDQSFLADHQLAYFRYADDILIFTESFEALEKAEMDLRSWMEAKGLQINPDKCCRRMPGEPWEFLGIRYHRGTVDLSDNTKRKIKSKIHRKARALYRWRNRKGASFGQTAHVFLRIFNRKFYDVSETGDFCWSKWFFPLINSTESLHEIDQYLLEHVRYLNSGRFYKGNYRIDYKEIKSLGYRSLVHEYYLGK